jgi:hypothetical protein
LDSQKIRDIERSNYESHLHLSLSSFPLVTEGNGGWIKPIGLPTPNGSVVLVIARMNKKERGYENEYERQKKNDGAG